jgi:hypothetical protein
VLSVRERSIAEGRDGAAFDRLTVSADTETNRKQIKGTIEKGVVLALLAYVAITAAFGGGEAGPASQSPASQSPTSATVQRETERAEVEARVQERLERAAEVRAAKGSLLVQ